MTFSTFIAYIRCLPKPIHSHSHVPRWPNTHTRSVKTIYLFPSQTPQNTLHEKDYTAAFQNSNMNEKFYLMCAARVRRPTSSLLWTSIWWMKSQEVMNIIICMVCQYLCMEVQQMKQRQREREQMVLFELAFVLNDKHTIRRKRTVYRPAVFIHYHYYLDFGIIIVIISLNWNEDKKRISTES